jgi:flagellar motor protein MotB
MSNASKVRRTGGRLLCVTALSLTMACSSPPKPVHPDGSVRVPVNDVTRIERVRQQAAADQSNVVERQAMKDEIGLLRSQLETMRKALQLIVAQPEAADAIKNAYPTTPSAKPSPTAPATSAPAPLSAPPARTPPERRSDADGNAATAIASLPPQAVDRIDDGLVFRAFHDSGASAFAPTREFGHLLLLASRDARQIVIWGRTDSPVRDELNQRVALSRALQARAWLVANGVEPVRIRARYTSAGHFLADNTSVEGRAVNRRVEIETQGTSLTIWDSNEG